jgi:hypothetical protein
MLLLRSRSYLKAFRRLRGVIGGGVSPRHTGACDPGSGEIAASSQTERGIESDHWMSARCWREVLDAVLSQVQRHRTILPPLATLGEPNATGGATPDSGTRETWPWYIRAIYRFTSIVAGAIGTPARDELRRTNAVGRGPAK